MGETSVGASLVADKKTKAPAVETPETDAPTWLDRLADSFQPESRGARALGTLMRIVGVTAGLAIAIGLLVGRDPLLRRVGELREAPIKARFEWPLVKQQGARPATWVPRVVQDSLVHLVESNVSMNPFDTASLERGRRLLLATGWFESVDTLVRGPNGIITIDATWRVPVALVRKNNRDYLVGRDAAPIRIPDGFKPMPGLYVIENPLLEPPVEGGRLAYGTPWSGGDVQAALDLLDLLKDSPAQQQITGIDLAEYLTQDEPKLLIVTDRRTKIVWGSAIGELAPGQVPVERRLARLEQQLRGFGRIDAQQERLEIYTPVVLVDKTAQRG